MAKEKGISTLAGIIIIILAAIILFGGVFVYEYFSIKNSQTTEPAPSEVEGWKTYTNSKYNFEIEYPDGWKTNDMVQACQEGIGGQGPCKPSDFIAPGINITSLSEYDQFSNPDEMSIGIYGSGFDYLNNKCLENKINIGGRTFCRTVGDKGSDGVAYSGYSDFTSYINHIRQEYGDVLTGKYTMGPYFNVGYWIKYNELNPKDSTKTLSVDIMEYKFGFEIKAALEKYYGENHSLPPIITEITPNTWCYDVFTEYKPLVDAQENLARIIIPTFKFTK